MRVLKPIFRTPIFEDDTISVKGNAILFQNVGQKTCTINDKWTLKPDTSLALGSSDNIDLIDLPNIYVMFSGSGTSRLEIIEQLVEICE